MCNEGIWNLKETDSGSGALKRLERGISDRRRRRRRMRRMRRRGGRTVQKHRGNAQVLLLRAPGAELDWAELSETPPSASTEGIRHTHA